MNIKTVFVITMIIASGGIVAAIPLTNTAFAEPSKCGLGTQDLHCSGLNPPDTSARAGSFKCNISANECSFSGNLGTGAGRCTGDLSHSTSCVGTIIIDED